MKKIILLPLLFLFGAMPVFAQYYTNQNKVWIFGYHAGIDFTTGAPVEFFSQIDQVEGCASVSSNSGSLLFFTEGQDVWNRLGNPMPHGSGLVTYDIFSTSQAA